MEDAEAGAFRDTFGGQPGLGVVHQHLPYRHRHYRKEMQAIRECSLPLAHELRIRLRLFTRNLNQPEAVPLLKTEDAYAPFFSPDGQWVGFFADGKLKKTRIEGGELVSLCEANSGRGASWSEDGNNQTVCGSDSSENGGAAQFSHLF